MGGKFTSAGNVTAFNVAAWDLSSGKWQPLYAGSQGNGLDNEALAMAVIGTDVYVGGWFTRAGPIPAAYIAKWDSLTGQWSTLGSGLDSGVYALEVSGTDLYVGGHFTKAGGADARCSLRVPASFFRARPVRAFFLPVVCLSSQGENKI